MSSLNITSAAELEAEKEKFEVQYKHITEREKDLAERIADFERQREKWENLAKEIKQREQERKLLETDIKNKQRLLASVTDGLDKLQHKFEEQSKFNAEIDVREKQIKMLEERVMVQEVQMEEMRKETEAKKEDTRLSEELKKLETEIEEKEKTNTEHKKRIVEVEENLQRCED